MKELAEKCSCLSSATLCAKFQEWNIFITSAPVLGTNITKHRFGPTLGEDGKLMEEFFVSFLVWAARVQWAAPPALRSLNPKQLAFVSYIETLTFFAPYQNSQRSSTQENRAHELFGLFFGVRPRSELVHSELSVVSIRWFVPDTRLHAQHFAP